MRVKCKRIISAATGEDISYKPNQSFTLERDYVVLGIRCTVKTGIELLIITDHYNSLARVHSQGFEFISQYIPSSWISQVSLYYDIQEMWLLPESWSEKGFFSAFDDEVPEAMEKFRKEVIKMYDEEEEHTGVKLVRTW